MLIDLLVVVLLAFAVFKGLQKGLIVAVFSLLAFIIGLAAAMKLSAVAAEKIGEQVNVSERWLPFIAFLVVFIIVVFLVRLGARAIEGAVNLAMMGCINKIGGVIFFALIYLFIFSIIIFYAEQLHIIKEDAMDASVTYPYLKDLAPKIIAGIAVVLPFFKDMFADLSSFFGDVSEQSK